MNRRRFLGALGGASSASLAGYTDAELDFSRDGTPYENPGDRIRFLERQRAVLLYAGGVTLAAAGEEAFPDLQVHPSKSDYGYAELAVLRGRASGYFDAAAWNFSRAGVVLSNIDGFDADVGVEACANARARAYHLGLGNAYRAVINLEERFGGAKRDAPASVLDRSDDGMQPAGTESGDDGGMQPAGTESGDDDTMGQAGTESSDDDAMSMAPPPEDDDGTTVSGDTPGELADAHFRRAKEFDVVSVAELRRGLGL